MQVNTVSRFDFKKCENSTTKKVLLNICDHLKYGITDSNVFYRNRYVNPQRDFTDYQKQGLIKLGFVYYSKILSYHILANIVCAELPKAINNLVPFKYEAFIRGCNNLNSFIEKYEIEEIHTPIFGTKILEGDWKKIVMILRNTLTSNKNLRLCIYE